MDYFEKETTPTGVDGIKAIWVASDDPDIVGEVRTLAPAYFPNVPSEAIVYAANGVTGGSNTTGVDTITQTQVCFTALGRLQYCHSCQRRHRIFSYVVKYLMRGGNGHEIKLSFDGFCAYQKRKTFVLHSKLRRKDVRW